jgi:hypothetical protein
MPNIFTSIASKVGRNGLVLQLSPLILNGMRCKRKIIRILGLWLFIVFPAMAQVLTGEAAPAVEAPPQPEFVQPADIPSASDRDHGKILELQQQSLPEEEINNIRSRVEALAESRKKLIAQKDFKHPERLNAQVQTNNALQLSTQKKLTMT